MAFEEGVELITTNGFTCIFVNESTIADICVMFWAFPNSLGKLPNDFPSIGRLKDLKEQIHRSAY